MRVLAISAHPDDETMFAGGKLASLAADGHDVLILCSTRGEGGEVGDPPVCEPERLGEAREVEMRCAGRALGAREVYFLDYVDPNMEVDGIASRIDATLDGFAASIREHLERLKPDVVVTHGSNGEYGHPQHVFTHQAVFEAVRQLDGQRLDTLLTWTAAHPDNLEDRLTNRDDPADEVLDISPWFEAKVAAVGCHVSQHAMMRRNNDGRELREIIRRTESYRHWPVEQVIRRAAAVAAAGG